jgi:RES domain
MSSPISTRGELSRSRRRAAGRGWRVVEGQHKVSTAKLTDTRVEQERLEALIEGTKPAIPAECRHLSFLLATPFRYGAPYPRGSRFRRAGYTPGVFYACENVDTAVAEICFGRLLFFADSPDTRWPKEAGEFTAFAAAYATESAIDLTLAPFDDRSAMWMDLTDYTGCQNLAETARESGIDLIRYASVRDPQHKLSLAILHCRVFARAEPVEYQTWRILLGSNGARAICETPREWIDFDRNAFLPDPRIAAMRWDR